MACDNDQPVSLCVSLRYTAPCAFHCAFHSAARVSLQAKVCRGKFPIINAFFPPLGFRQIVQHVQLHVA